MIQHQSHAPYELLLGKVDQAAARVVDHLTIGLTWTICKASLQDNTKVAANYGLAMSLGEKSRTLPWPGTLVGRSVSELSQWLLSWNTIEAAVGLAAVNASLNNESNTLLRGAEKLGSGQHPNLAVFNYFKPRLKGKKVVIVGRYPGIYECLQGLDVSILERAPSNGDFPDTAAEFLIPEADWVFITASSLINKSFPRLAALAEKAQSVLMGPSTPWLQEWADFGINYLAGVKLSKPENVQQIAAEGGGTRIFGSGACYALANIAEV